MKRRIIPFVFFILLVFSNVFIGCKQDANLLPEPSITSIYVSKQPIKLSYDLGESLTLEGLEVKAKYSDNSEKVLKGWTSSPQDGTPLTTSGTVTVTISYEEKKTDFTVTVKEKELVSIYISKKPNKLDYEYDSKLDLTGIEVKGKYNDNSEKVLENWISSPKDGTKLKDSGTITVTISYAQETTQFTINVKGKILPLVTANEYFWGTWVRMDNGTEYEVLETNVRQGSQNYEITNSSDTTLTVSHLGTFTKESDSVMVCNNIPYFRKGGANLEYSLKLIGFSSSSRAAGIAMSGIKGKGKSSKYKNFVSNSESDNYGNIKFTAPTANDLQTVEITNGDEIVVIPGLTINNTGDYMGTIALVGKDDYNLKITGTISDDQKDNGYLFGNNAKTYNMVLTITNISENKCSTSACSVESEDSNLVLSSETNLKGFTISTLAGGATKTINLSLSYGEITVPYVDTGITVTIKNPFTEQEWKDYIPLRFFKGTIPITVSARNPENNNNAALNGFVIYPDGNNQFFAIPNNSCKPIFVPTFGMEKPYKLVFSGATVTSQLDDSTEMYYTVEPASLNPKTVVIDGELDEILQYITFGGQNHSENTAYSVTEGFQAFLREGEIDYYSITADSNTYYGPGGNTFYSVSYENEKGDEPDTFLSTEGTILNTSQLPEMECEGYEFLGWYLGDKKVVAGSYAVYGNIILKAKWLKKCLVQYVSSYGNPPESIIIMEGTELTTEQLPKLTEQDWIFRGWYADSSFTKSSKVQVGFEVTQSIMLYAKWEEYGVPSEGFVFVEGGTVVGSNDYNQNNTGVFPAGRTVILSSFFICDHEVTQGEYEAVMGRNPSYFNSNPESGEIQTNRPVEQVSWYDAIYFCNTKSISENLNPCYSVNGNTDPSSWSYTPNNSDSINETIICNFNANGYRLPTEAEWEFAARGGMETYGTTAFANYYAGVNTTNYTASSNSNLDSIAWYKNTSRSKTHEVKKKAPNVLGLYDMNGNVWEWCWDWYCSSISSHTVSNPSGATSGSSRIRRGGSWYFDASYCSVSIRGSGNPCHRDSSDGIDYGFRVVCSAEKRENINESQNQSNSTDFTSNVELLPVGTDGTAGTGATYVLFGDWPQKIKAGDVVIDESISEVHGGFIYYRGSDGNWYVKCAENAYDSSYKYSDGTTIAQSSANSTKYFKVEPIKWRVLTTNYNDTGKALLLAENILTSNIPYYLSDSNRTIDSSTIYSNNYKYSTIRAFLNGYYEIGDTQNAVYNNKGFLQSAFTLDAQNLISITNIDNSSVSTSDSDNNIKQATSYYCVNTRDKVFLLSEKEVTTADYGFASYNSYGQGNTRIRKTTDFAKANHAYQNSTNCYGGWWWLRSPHYWSGLDARGVHQDGYATGREAYDFYFSNTHGGIVPALTILLPSEYNTN